MDRYFAKFNFQFNNEEHDFPHNQKINISASDPAVRHTFI